MRSSSLTPLPGPLSLKTAQRAPPPPLHRSRPLFLLQHKLVEDSGATSLCRVSSPQCNSSPFTRPSVISSALHRRSLPPAPSTTSSLPPLHSGFFYLFSVLANPIATLANPIAVLPTPSTQLPPPLTQVHHLLPQLSPPIPAQLQVKMEKNSRCVRMHETCGVVFVIIEGEVSTATLCCWDSPFERGSVSTYVLLFTPLLIKTVPPYTVGEEIDFKLPGRFVFANPARTRSLLPFYVSATHSSLLRSVEDLPLGRQPRTRIGSARKDMGLARRSDWVVWEIQVGVRGGVPSTTTPGKSPWFDQ